MLEARAVLLEYPPVCELLRLLVSQRILLEIWGKLGEGSFRNTSNEALAALNFWK